VPTNTSSLTFGDYTLDLVSGQLRRGATPVPMTPKSFAVLQYLVARPGHLISKHELLDAIWPGVFVGEAVLKTTIRDVRRALGDDSQTPRYIETAHRRGYRFIATVTTQQSVAKRPITGSPPVRYARSGNVNIAYQVVGDGPIDVVFVMGWVSHLEYFWNEPSFARFLGRLAAKARLIVFDKRGTGLSDPVPIDQLPSLEQRLDDVRAVMEAAGSARAVLMGVSEGGPLCSVFAATYPDRCEALVMIGSYARRLHDADYPWGPTREQHARFCQSIVDNWGGPVGLEERAPSKLHDSAFREWWASYLRMGASPGAAVALTRMNAEIDIRDVLPCVRVPTLVLHRSGDRCLKVEEGRYLASRIPGAELVELPGADHLPFVGDQDAMLREIERFLSRTRARRPSSDRVLASVLTVVWEPGARRDVDHLPSVIEREVTAARGQPITLSESRVVSSFDGPGRAVKCGAALLDVVARAGAVARAGVHIGERVIHDHTDHVVRLSAEIAAAAPPGELHVSRTIADLLPGSGLQFDARGELAGADAALPLFSARVPDLRDER
jgi:pimeloyl-ACP methyl ester carboxylesterase/DNA-binding winged helix-turn-helix (wHTH) protein/plasmid stabilization system protein ParE